MATVWWFIGADLGQSQDPTALAVLERAELKGEFDPAVFAWRKEVALRLRYLERVALETPYPEIVERVRRLTRAPELAGRCHVAVDATGVGRPVVDMLRNAELGATMLPAIITGGAAESLNKGYYSVPKRDLITGLQVLLQRGGLRIAAGLKHGPDLVTELTGMRVRVGGRGGSNTGRGGKGRTTTWCSRWRWRTGRRGRCTRGRGRGRRGTGGARGGGSGSGSFGRGWRGGGVGWGGVGRNGHG